jgi:hypothetical protein
VNEVTRSWHTVVALFGAASFLTPEAVYRAYRRANHQLVMMHWHNAGDQHQHDMGIRLPDTAVESARAARQLPGAQTMRMGDWDVTLAKK